LSGFIWETLEQNGMSEPEIMHREATSRNYVLDLFFKLLVVAVVLFACAVLLAVFCWPVPGTPPGPHTYEAEAVSRLGNLSVSQELFHEREGRYASLKELEDAGLMPLAWAEEFGNTRPDRKFNYSFVIEKDKWSCTAIPTIPGKTAEHSFFMDESGIIRRSPYARHGGKPAGPNSPSCELMRDYGDIH
jgi:hypothetical protein